MRVGALVIELTGAKSKLRFEPRPSDDPRHQQPDVSEAKLRLG
jgi:UDP-glucuronate decarboxylase